MHRLILLLGPVLGALSSLANVYIHSRFRCAGVVYRGLVLTVSTHIEVYPWAVTVGFNPIKDQDRDVAKQFKVKQIAFYRQVSHFKSQTPVLLKVADNRHLATAPAIALARENVEFAEFGLLGWGFSNSGLAYHEAIASYRTRIFEDCSIFPLHRPATRSCFEFEDDMASYVAEGSPVYNLDPRGYRLVGLYTGKTLDSAANTTLEFLNVTTYAPWLVHAAQSLATVPPSPLGACASLGTNGRVCQVS